MLKERKLIKEVIEAWENLPEGNYSPEEIGDWLVDVMHPVINKCRKLIKEK